MTKEDQLRTTLLDIIDRVKFVDIIAGEVGTFMDAYFEQEGWELQLVYGENGTTGYQTFFGEDVSVDNHYQYGFSFLYDLEDVVAFANDFYARKTNT